MLVSRIFRSIISKEVLNSEKSYKDLYELAAQHNSKGIGFHIWRNTWPPKSYYTITKMDLKILSHGKAWGVLTWKGKKGLKVERIASPLKRGTWRFKIPEVTIDQDDKSDKGKK